MRGENYLESGLKWRANFQPIKTAPQRNLWTKAHQRPFV